MDEKKWLQNKTRELHKYVGLLITAYDDGLITRQALDARVAILCENYMSTTYNHAFTLGLESAELTGDDTDELDFDFGEDHPE
jgi:hypothetical protein